MAYFNHSFTKTFLGTQLSTVNTNINLYNGFLISGGLPSVTLTQTGQANPNNEYGPGSFGFFNPETWLSVDPDLAGYNGCCPLYLISAPLVTADKISPFIGGYQETNKSKLINPKFIHRIYSVKACVPQQAVTSIGRTPHTQDLSPADAACCFEFLCGETYYLRIDLKGSPALRFMNHNAYQNIFAYTGCCPDPNGPPVTNQVVDSTLVMIDWATQIVNNPYITPFVVPVVYAEAAQVSTFNGVSYTEWYPSGTTVTLDGADDTVSEGQWFENYPTGTTHTADACAGIRLFGAYVDTKFGNCSFQLTDFYEKELIKIYASLVDINGDPCTFEGICVYNDCDGVQGMGFGETVVRDLIMSQSYLQNFFATDIRIREITQGDQILGSVDRNALYTRYYIQHTVPRYNNPTGTFDSDQYMLEIIVSEPNPAVPVGNGPLEAFLNAWSSLCIGCATPEDHTCTHCEISTDANYTPAG